MAFANDEYAQPDKTEVLQGDDIIIKKTLETFLWTKKSMNGSLDKDGPAVHVLYDPIWNGLVSLKKKGIKIRCITEVTPDNIHYCKKLMKVGEIRHLDGIRTNFGIADKKQVLLHGVSRESDPISQAILTSVKGLVEAQQYMFENLWSKAIPAMDTIKEIEEGIEPIQTRVLENQDEIYNRFLDIIKKSKERFVCSSIGGMQIIYNNFFNLYKEIIEKQKRGEGHGVKWFTFIDNNKDSIELVKKFLDVGIQVRHIKNLPSMNFSFNSNSIQATIGGMKDGKFLNRLLVSNEPAYVTQFTLYFKDLWENYANSEGPIFMMGLVQLRKELKNAFARGVKIRCISEITKRNINYCKQLMKIGELRHLEGAKGWNTVNEVEYISTAHLQEGKNVSCLIYSDIQEVVDQQQLVFDGFWDRAITAEERIKEIEDEYEKIDTTILDDREKIYSKLDSLAETSDELLICSGIESLQMTHALYLQFTKK